MATEETGPAIQPALTGEQWTAFAAGAAVEVGSLRFIVGAPVSFYNALADDRFEVDHSKRHTVAALCLYGQPFGFTQEEFEALGELVESAERSHVFLRSGQDGDPLLASAVAKIRALLPSERP